MSWDLLKLLDDHRITHSAVNNRGWVSLECPHCQRGGQKLGWNQQSQVFFCWYCRGHSIPSTLTKMLSLSNPGVYQLLEKYKTSSRLQRAIEQPDRVVPDELLWPEGIGPLQEQHRRYLRSRGLDPEEIERLWRPLATGPVAESLYASRIFAPLYFNGEIVSWQGRSIRADCDKAFRYQTCPKEKEIIPCKSIVYGWDYAIEQRRAVVVEGLFDVWKLGPGAVHTFGTAWCSGQVKLLKELDWIGIAFDNGPDEAEAQRQAMALAQELAGQGKEVCLIDWEVSEKDMGETDVIKARRMMMELGFRPAATG